MRLCIQALISIMAASCCLCMSMSPTSPKSIHALSHPDETHTFSCHSQKSFKSYIPSAVRIRNHSKVTYLQLSQSEIIQKLRNFSCHNQKSFKGYIPSAVTIRNHPKVTYLQLSQSEIIQKLHTFSCPQAVSAWSS